MAPSSQSETWVQLTLRAAGLYNLAIAALVLLRPEWILTSLGLPPTPPAGFALELWHALAALTAAMGAGYLLISSNPVKHWQVVLVGFLAKLATGLWVSYDIYLHRLPSSAWLWVVMDDAIWLPPFAIVLRQAHECLLNIRRSVSPDVVRFALRRKTNYGVTVDEISRLSPVLLVFLRHAGCTFCREALADLSSRRGEIERDGTRLVLVHMGSEEHAAGFFRQYGLAEVPRISDPERALYRAFGLPRGSFSDVMGPKVWLRAFQSGVLERHGVGQLVGDGFQMPGVFLVFHGEIVRSYRHQCASDRPDYLALVTGRDYAAPELRDRSV
ncbi:MAG: AhpC/TSA family protein [Acidobacteria bacterium]|nr:AhpC/TSA family protein [Acidobacteriota bacterium]